MFSRVWEGRVWEVGRCGMGCGTVGYRKWEGRV